MPNQEQAASRVRKAVTAIRSAGSAQKLLGPCILEWRTTSGTKQADLAAKLGITPQHLCDVEAGRRGFSDSVLLRLMEAL